MIGSQIYGDEQGVFRCDTNQPGCQAMCFNKFSPMSHPRFWSFQFMFCLLPSFIFMMVTINQEAQMKKVDHEMKKIQNKIDQESDEIKKKEYYSSSEYKTMEKKKKKIGIARMKTKTTTDQGGLTEVIWTPKIRFWFIFQLGVKVVMEMVFIYLYYILQKQQSKQSGFAAWHVPDKYLCSYGAEKINYACSQNDNIPCWVSRPMEKEVMMWYMLTMSLVSTALVLGEFFYVVTRVTVKAQRRKSERKMEKAKLLEKPLLPPANDLGSEKV
jgi:uncharacterized membrane-anchored protein YhcB (DUF1043 family)